MTLRSRLSAAWKAFKRDDFPPQRFLGTVECRECMRTLPPEQCYIGPAGGCPMHGNPSVRLDLKANTTYHVNAPATVSIAEAKASMAEEWEAQRKKDEALFARLNAHVARHSVDMSPHPLPTIVDETEAIRAEEQRELSKLTPDYSSSKPPEITQEITQVWYNDNFGNLWLANLKDGRVIPTGIPWRPEYSNLEVPTILRRRRKKLVSVPKE